MSPPFVSLFSIFLFSLISRSQSLTLSSRLIHRCSDEARAAVAAAGGGEALPARRSPEYYKLLIKSDLQRQKKRIANVKYQQLFPAAGSDTFSLGNDFGWWG